MKDWDEEEKWVRDAVRSGSSVRESSFLSDYELAFGNWYRSKGIRSGDNPFASYMMSKKWTLEEEFNNHVMMFQQVTVSYYYFSKQQFNIPGWIDSQ